MTSTWRQRSGKLGPRGAGGGSVWGLVVRRRRMVAGVTLKMEARSWASRYLVGGYMPGIANQYDLLPGDNPEPAAPSVRWVRP